MVVRIRLARFGRRHEPFYNIVIAQARYVAPRSSRPLPNPNAAGNALTAIERTRLIYAQSNRSARNSKPLEVIGTYNPKPQRPTDLSEKEAATAKPFKAVGLDQSRAKYWLGVGAQPSETVWKLLRMVR